MHQAVFAGQDGDKSTEVDDTRHLTGVDLTHFRFSRDRLNHLDCGITRRRVLAKDLDRAVIIDVDSRTRLFRDLTNRRATLADDVADLVLIHFQRGHTGRVFRSDLTGRVQNRIHLAEDVQSCLERLLQRTFHDLFVDTLDLDIHLQSRHALRGSRDLEVHVAKMVLVTENIGQHGKLVAFLDQAHRNTRNRRRQWYTGSHQRQRTHTYRRHGTGAIGFGDLGHHSHGVRELFLVRQYRSQTASRQTAMADLSTTGRTDTARFTHRVRREVVVQHKGITPLSLKRIDNLRVAG